MCVHAPYLGAPGRGGFFHLSQAGVADFPELPEPAGPSQSRWPEGFLVAAGQTDEGVKPQDRGQRERGAEPGAAAAAEKQTTSGPVGKKQRGTRHETTRTDSGAATFRRTGGGDIYILAHLRVVFWEPANNPVFMLLYYLKFEKL